MKAELTESQKYLNFVYEKMRRSPLYKVEDLHHTHIFDLKRSEYDNNDIHIKLYKNGNIYGFSHYNGAIKKYQNFICLKCDYVPYFGNGFKRDTDSLTDASNIKINATKCCDRDSCWELKYAEKLVVRFDGRYITHILKKINNEKINTEIINQFLLNRFPEIGDIINLYENGFRSKVLDKLYELTNIVLEDTEYEFFEKKHFELKGINYKNKPVLAKYMRILFVIEKNLNLKYYRIREFNNDKKIAAFIKTTCHWDNLHDQVDVDSYYQMIPRLINNNSAFYMAMQIIFDHFKCYEKIKHLTQEITLSKEQNKEIWNIIITYNLHDKISILEDFCLIYPCDNYTFILYELLNKA